MPSIKDILKIYSIKATKKLSQNFIMKKRVTDDIVKKIDAVSLRNAFVLEVGIIKSNYINFIGPGKQPI